MAKKKYYDITNLLSTEAQYMMPLGQRANGKSYQVKKTVLEHFIKTGKKFVYLRRYAADIKTKAVEAYFDDVPISEMTDGAFLGVMAYSNTLYFGKLNEKDQMVKDVEIGRFLALNERERYKSWAFVDYDYIIYEEFITDGIYLFNEPTALQQLVSTVLRRNEGTVFLIGNTLSRVSPYFREWSLDFVPNMKKGTIEVCNYHTEQGDTIKVAVEMCEVADYDNKMYFGQAQKQIVSGEWETRAFPHLVRAREYYEKVYEVMVVYQSFKFCMELLIDGYTGGKIVFIYPLTTDRKILRVITDEFTDDPYTNNQLNQLRPEQMIRECFRNNKVCYSDNLTGTDFSHVIEYLKL